MRVFNEQTSPTSNIVKFQILSKPHISTGGIAKVLECSEGSASKIKLKIESEIPNEDRFIQRIPTKAFMQKMHLDLQEIYDLALKEKNLGGAL